MAQFKNVAMGAAALVACASLAAGFEGLRTTAYHDTLANGLPTVCYGETKGVKMGDKYTPDECHKMLEDQLPRYWEAISPCIKVLISNNEKVAYTDFAYNVGSAGFCGSGLLKKLNNGDHLGACNGLMAWDHASGVQVMGLTRRRAAERAICLKPDTRKPIDHITTTPDVTRAQITKHIAKVSEPHDVPKPPQCTQVLFWKVCK